MVQFEFWYSTPADAWFIARSVGDKMLRGKAMASNRKLPQTRPSETLGYLSYWCLILCRAMEGGTACTERGRVMHGGASNRNVRGDCDCPVHCGGRVSCVPSETAAGHYRHLFRSKTPSTMLGSPSQSDTVKFIPWAYYIR